MPKQQIQQPMTQQKTAPQERVQPASTTAHTGVQGQQPVVQKAAQQPSTANVRRQQPAVQQDVESIITYPNAPGFAAKVVKALINCALILLGRCQAKQRVSEKV